MSRTSPAPFAAGFAVAAALWFGLFFAQLGMPTRGSTWIHELIVAKERAAAAERGPRLIVLGGSGVLYSVRARDLSRALGIPVVNGGLHAGLGRDYILHEARRLARPGDTLLLALEYEMYLPNKHSAVLVDYLSAWDPGYFGRFDVMDQLHDVLGMPFDRLVNPFLLKAFHTFPPYPFYLDDEGDVLQNNSVLKTDAMLGNVVRNWPAIRTPYPESRQELLELARWAGAHGVRLLATHPQTAFFAFYLEDRASADNLESIRRLHEDLGMPFIDTWMDALMDRTLFFDSVYHTSDLGTAIRTHALAERLRPYVEGRPWGAVPGPVHRGNHPLEVIDISFHRFEPLQGFGPVQGIDPPSPEPFITSMPPQSEAVIRTLAATRGHLVARVKGLQPGQSLEVRVDNVPIGTWALALNEFRRFEADVVLRAGANTVTLTHSAGSASPIEIAEWRVDIPAAAVYPAF